MIGLKCSAVTEQPNRGMSQNMWLPVGFPSTPPPPEGPTGALTQIEVDPPAPFLWGDSCRKHLNASTARPAMQQRHTNDPLNREISPTTICGLNKLRIFTGSLRAQVVLNGFHLDFIPGHQTARPAERAPGLTLPRRLAPVGPVHLRGVLGHHQRHAPALAWRFHAAGGWRGEVKRGREKEKRPRDTACGLLRTHTQAT